MYTPIFNALMKYADSNPLPFHMPGHKLGRGIPAEFSRDLLRMDVTEIPGMDNLHFPNGAIREAQELAARAFGADNTFFLVNGSTCGIHSAIMTICRPGDALIVGRDCHKSVVSGMMLAGANPVYISPRLERSFGIPSVIMPEDVEDALRQNPDAAGVLITRPNYYGICSDIKRIAEIVHSYGKVLVVDEAHGAHLAFNKKLPVPSIHAGADICVQSAHKTLPALTQGAYLHVKGGRVDGDRLKFNLGMLQTSSPSYMLMAFLDIARAFMEEKGAGLLDYFLDDVEWLKTQLHTEGRMALLSAEDMEQYCSHDPTRLVINVSKTGKTGFEVEKLVRKNYNIQVEMSDFSNIICIGTCADEKQHLEGLYKGLLGLIGKKAMETPFNKIQDFADMYIRNLKIPQCAIPLKDVMNLNHQYVDIKHAGGRVSAGMVTPYPPGIPLVCPGEIISQEHVAYICALIDAGGTVNGIEDDMTVSVV